MRKLGDVSQWDDEQARSYAANRHGPDGKFFLDPDIIAFLDSPNIADKKVLDIGCGTGPWSLYAHQQGAQSVTAFDLNAAMTAQARKLFEAQGGIPNSVTITEHDAGQLPDVWESCFDRLLSINVGCNLSSLRAHFSQAYRVATPGAKMLVTAPNSLPIVFDDGEDSGITEMLSQWQELPEEARNSAEAKRLINTLSHVRRATFALLQDSKHTQLQLVTQALQDGMPIIRRIPGLAVDNNYHEPSAYVTAAEESGWRITKKYERVFGTDAEHQTYLKANPTAALGTAYKDHAPFLVMELEK